MKRQWIVVSLALSAMLFVGAQTIRSSGEQVPTKKVCSRGYTVIEASLGIDCHGDTIQLRKVGGYYEPVLQESPRLSRIR